MHTFVNFIAWYFTASVLVKLLLIAKGENAPVTPARRAIGAVECAVLATIAFVLL